MNYAVLLARSGVAGEVRMPITPERCEAVLEEIQDYLANLNALFNAHASEITSDQTMHDRIMRERLRRIVTR